MKRFFFLFLLTIGIGLSTKAFAAESCELPVYTAQTMCEFAAELHKQPVDLDALAYAIARQETGGCTTGVGASKNNCFGIRQNHEYVTFASPEESHRYFKKMWTNSRYYAGTFPTCAEARIYKDPNITGWMTNVIRFYHSARS